MDHAQAMREHVLDRDRQHRLGRRAERVFVLCRPSVQPLRERGEQRREVRTLLSGPQLRPPRDAVGAHPAIGVEIRVTVEFGAAAARLRVEPQQQFGVRFHLRVSVRVEQAWIVRTGDVRDAVAVPQDFGALRGDGCDSGRGGANEREKHRQVQDGA
jgi:hypothetical protein